MMKEVGELMEVDSNCRRFQVDKILRVSRIQVHL